ncbi:MAG: C_GCAxxG_C_C family protein [Bacteroidales bacterium]|nr:C_GCAxxG_C_C family protein [Bacteroidales bacterium]
MSDQAINHFRSGLNCAQSVLITYAGKYNIDNSAALSMACGFGAGMGRLQETCGAATGAFMVIGLHFCRKSSDNKERKEHSYAAIQAFERRFCALNKTLLCKDLLKTDLKTPEGQLFWHENNLGEKVCEKCIGDAVAILDELLT